MNSFNKCELGARYHQIKTLPSGPPYLSHLFLSIIQVLLQACLLKRRLQWIAALIRSKICVLLELSLDFPGGSDGKASAYNAGDPGLIPGLGKSSGEGNGNPLQYSCLENPMDRGAWRATIHGVAESDMTERLYFHFHFIAVTVPVWDFMFPELLCHFESLKQFLRGLP